MNKESTSVGQHLDTAMQASIITAEQLLAAQATALQYLADRQRTAHEVRQKLRRSGVADQVTEQVIALLQARGALDDTAYAHAYLTSRLASRGYGPQRLRRELQQRGIGRALVEEAAQQELAAEDVLAAARVQAAPEALATWTRAIDLFKRSQYVLAISRFSDPPVLAAARAQAAKRWPRLARETDLTRRRQKLWAFLRRRGFPAAIVQQVLMEMAEETAAEEKA